MSRKCPRCSKWLTAGQYQCSKCGRSEEVDQALKKIEYYLRKRQVIPEELFEIVKGDPVPSSWHSLCLYSLKTLDCVFSLSEFVNTTPEYREEDLIDCIENERSDIIKYLSEKHVLFSEKVKHAASEAFLKSRLEESRNDSVLEYVDSERHKEHKLDPWILEARKFPNPKPFAREIWRIIFQFVDVETCLRLRMVCRMFRNVYSVSALSHMLGPKIKELVKCDMREMDLIIKHPVGAYYAALCSKSSSNLLAFTLGPQFSSFLASNLWALDLVIKGKTEFELQGRSLSPG